MRRILLLALPLVLSACASTGQSKLGNFVNGVIKPGMSMDQAMVRMQAEGFYCSAANPGDTVTPCSRAYPRLLRSSCEERVDLIRSAGSANTLGGIDVLELKCP
ncbi:hypothetical protein [Duganella callida]|uniref:Lipoprotein n=1 Tax=Duganella callida TaxID=2561932 RepID=A0A4Y9SFI3_9BURK|nr:hypothetical protein [Duganella callida]TFW18714.1 hypothetical protein E4L98_17885 [Duganella callida]